MKIIPPLPNYSSGLPGPSSTIPPNVRHPQLTLHWSGFEQETLHFIDTEIVSSTERMVGPVFELIDEPINNEAPALQMFCSRNLFRIVAVQMGCTVFTTERGNSIGATDGYIEKNGCIATVYEIKGKWTLNPNWFKNGRIDGINISNYIQNAQNQIYTYMVLNHLQYGILSSFDYTFFFKRVKVEDAPDGFEQLFISTGIPYNATNPTILQCIAYFLLLADGTPFKSPPPSPLRMSPRNSRASSARNSPGPLRSQKDTSISQSCSPLNY